MELLFVEMVYWVEERGNIEGNFDCCLEMDIGLGRFVSLINVGVKLFCFSLLVESLRDSEISIVLFEW